MTGKTSSEIAAMPLKHVSETFFRALHVKMLSRFIGNANEHSDAFVSRCVTSDKFEGFVAIFILGNCMTLGLEAEVFVGSMEGCSSAISIFESFFTWFFTLELLLRLYAIGWRAYVFGRDNILNIFDAVLVLMTDIVWLLLATAGDAGTFESSAFIRSLSAFRAIRLMRLLRVVHKTLFFREVWLLFRGLASSLRILWWTMVVIFFVTYVFAIFGVVLVSVDVKRGIAGTVAVDTLTHEELERLWESTGGVLTWMYTFIQVLTLDSWNGILRPLMLVSPWSWVLFYLYISFAVIVLMNLVTAILVENAFKCAHIGEAEEAAIRENERLADLNELQDLFKSLDEDGSGDISWEEFEAGFSKPAIRFQMQKLDIHKDDLKPLFELLDTGDGILSLEEFFVGIQRVRGVATAKETFLISKSVEQLYRLVEKKIHAVELQMKTDVHDCEPPEDARLTTSLDAITSVDRHLSFVTNVLSNASRSDLEQDKRRDGMKIALSADPSHECSEAGRHIWSRSESEDVESSTQYAASIQDLVGRSLPELTVKLNATIEDARSRYYLEQVKSDEQNCVDAESEYHTCHQSAGQGVVASQLEQTESAYLGVGNCVLASIAHPLVNHVEKNDDHQDLAIPQPLRHRALVMTRTRASHEPSAPPYSTESRHR